MGWCATGKNSKCSSNLKDAAVLLHFLDIKALTRSREVAKVLFKILAALRPGVLALRLNSVQLSLSPGDTGQMTNKTPYDKIYLLQILQPHEVAVQEQPEQPLDCAALGATYFYFP
jgi:hypothetical protein